MIFVEITLQNLDTFFFSSSFFLVGIVLCYIALYCNFYLLIYLFCWIAQCLLFKERVVYLISLCPEPLIEPDKQYFLNRDFKKQVKVGKFPRKGLEKRGVSEYKQE